MIALSLDPIAAAHLLAAIRSWRNVCRGTGRRFPADLAELEKALVEEVRREQEGTKVDSGEGAGDPNDYGRGRDVDSHVLFTVQEVAARVGLSVKTVRRSIAAGDLEAVRIGRNVRIHPDEVRRVLEPEMKETTE